MKVLFVVEKRSPSAIRMGVTWEDKRLASKQLFDAFEAIELTATDMMVTQRGVPFPVMVPSFPILTTDSRLDYGSKKD